MILIDSNIWIYYLDPTTKEHEKVKMVIKETIIKEKILSSPIIWMEVAHYLFKVSSMPRRGLAEKLKKLMKLATMEIAEFDVDILNMGIDVLSELQEIKIGGRDAAIIATMMKYNVRKIMTHDKAFRKIKDLVVIDPVEE